MSKRILLCLTLCLFLVLIATRPTSAAEQTVIIKDVGTLFLPTNIEVFPLNNKTNDDIGKTLIAKDNNLLRSISIMYVPLDNKKMHRMGIKRNAKAFESQFLEPTVKTFFKNIIYNSPIEVSALDNQKRIIKSIMFIDYGIVVAGDFYLVDGAKDLVLLLTLCPDGDRNYWMPIISKIIINLKR